MSKAKRFRDITEQEVESVFGKENIFEDADLILEENIFDSDNLQNKVFTNANDNDKQAVVQIVEQIEVPDSNSNNAEFEALIDGFEAGKEKTNADESQPAMQEENEPIAQAEKQVEQETDKEIQKSEQQNTEQKEEHKYGKFKNPEELLKAYGELEKEFTRRSQKLKELESASEEAFKSEEDWRTAVDKFFEETPSAKVFSKDIANEIISHPELKKDKNCLSIALTRTLVSKFRTPEQLLSDGQFLNDYVLKSQAVKDAVIAEYLRDVRDGKPPLVLGGGGKQFATSAKSPKTIEEAGFMFLKENK